MTVQLLPCYVRGITFAPEPLDTAPSYVRSRDANRWHRPRSGWRFAKDRVAIRYWCGADASDCLGVEETPVGDDVCGTCEGRFQAQQDGTLVFTPRSSLPPRICPATGVQNPAWMRPTRSFPCLVCGEDVTAPPISRYYSGRHIIRHKPGPGLIPPPCRVHGWFYLRLVDGRIVCACTIDLGEVA
ncbi:hypothetical protein [Amycolatopsis sp. NPDC059657]|uniref:hypothetical protein n=1 Tax=Amycolatopsis sp. NPDC059657 TaxID=3346899 RepID=UPI00366AEC62